jgi:hypothetical protein
MLVFLEGPTCAQHSSMPVQADDDLPICWICLGHSEPDRPLTHPCRCPSWCHSTCVSVGGSGSTRQALDRHLLAIPRPTRVFDACLFLLQVARWQLQSAGTRYVVLAALVLAADVPMPISACTFCACGRHTALIALLCCVCLQA